MNVFLIPEFTGFYYYRIDMPKFLIAEIAIVLICVYWVSFVNVIKRINWKKLSIFFFFWGFILFIPFWILVAGKMDFFITLEHEFAHMIAGLLFLYKPVKLVIYPSGEGCIGFSGGNFIIALAPYFLPTYNLLLLILYPFIKNEFKYYFCIALGFFTSYHLFSTFEEFNYTQTDITNTGPVFSTIVVIFLNLIVYGIIISFVSGGGKRVKYFLLHGMKIVKSWFTPEWKEYDKPQNLREWIEEFF